MDIATGWAPFSGKGHVIGFGRVGTVRQHGGSGRRRRGSSPRAPVVYGGAAAGRSGVAGGGVGECDGGSTGGIGGRGLGESVEKTKNNDGVWQPISNTWGSTLLVGSWPRVRRDGFMCFH